MAKSVLVVGGGPAGLSAARALGRLGIKTILVEKTGTLGGNPIQNHYHTLIPRKLKPSQVLGPYIKDVESDPNITVKLNTELEACEGEPGNYRVRLSNGETHEVGAIVVATGFQHFDPRRKGETDSSALPTSTVVGTAVPCPVFKAPR